MLFNGIANADVIADDINVARKDEAEHEALRQVLQCARERKVRFSPQKIQYKIPHVRYMVHIHIYTYCQATAYDQHALVPFGVSVSQNRTRK